MAPRGPGERANLDRSRVVAAAVDIAARDGIDRLSMRAVADAVGVTPNALYSHVRDKAELVSAVLDEALRAVHVPEATGGVAELEHTMRSTYDVLVARPDVARAMLERGGSGGPVAQRLGARMRPLLAAAGVTLEEVEEALHVLVVQAIGFAAFASVSPVTASEDPRPARRREVYLRALSWTLDGLVSSSNG